MDLLEKVDPELKNQRLAREAAEKQKHEQGKSERAKMVSELYLGDVVDMNARRKSKFDRNEVKTARGQCNFQGGYTTLVKREAGKYYLAVPKSYEPGYASCAEEVVVLSTDQMVDWYVRTMKSTKPVAYAGKCYRGPETNVNECKAKEHTRVDLEQRLKQACPKIRAVYNLQSTAGMDNYKLSNQYSGITFLANENKLKLEEVKYCETGMPAAAESFSACLKRHEVVCESPRVGQEESAPDLRDNAGGSAPSQEQEVPAEPEPVNSGNSNILL